MNRLAGVGALWVLLTLSCIHVQDSNIHHGVDALEDSALEVGDELQEKTRGVPSGLVTDTEIVERESESISPRKTLRSQSEKFKFQAEVSRLMDIIINSLYSSKDIFLRELISNASDALDKVRFLALTNKTLLGEGDDAKLDIHIKLDKERNILTIKDKGIGMTKEDLIKNLGTIAKSGTSSFVDQLQTGDDVTLIGQFGVGFYSVYLIADYVEVISKHNDDKQDIWESKADGNFAVSEDTENAPLGRGTEIKLHLKEDAAKYITTEKLRELVKRYSEFINFPIYLWTSKEIEKPFEGDDGNTLKEEVSDNVQASETQEVDLNKVKVEEHVREEEKPKMIKHTEWAWELVNDVKAVWLKDPKEVTAEEYKSFYHSLTKDFGEEPLGWTHFKAEGDVDFKAVLFIPPTAPDDLFDSYYLNKVQIKMYVRRVLFSDDLDELLPKYLVFLQGIVDSDTFPLNVSREVLQQHVDLKTIKKKLIRKALNMFDRLAESDPDEKIPADNDPEDKLQGMDGTSRAGKRQVRSILEGKAIKMGIFEDPVHRHHMAELIRFHSSKSGERLTSFDQYISRMKPNQTDIYFIAGQDRKQLEKSPFLEKLLKKDFEVIYFVDPLDEHVIEKLPKFKKKNLQNASKDDLHIGGKDEKKKSKELGKMYKELTKWWKKLLKGQNVETVKISSRLVDTPSVVVTSKTGWSSNMERVMLAQVLVDTDKARTMTGQWILEINHRHPIIQELRKKVALDPKDEVAQQSAKLIYETTLLESGFILENPKEFALHVHAVLGSNLNLGKDIQVEEEHEAEEDEEEEDQMDSHTVENNPDVIDFEDSEDIGDVDTEDEEDFRQGIVDPSNKTMKAHSKRSHRGAVWTLQTIFRLCMSYEETQFPTELQRY